MNNFSYEKASIEMLIDFGKSDIVESLASIDKVKHLGKLSYLNRKGRKFWKEVSTYLTREDLQALIKAITVLETQLQWSGGSVAAVIWLYEIYKQSETDKNRELADWILSRTRNPYLPFGCNNFGARSYHEFLRSQETWEEHSCNA